MLQIHSQHVVSKMTIKEKLLNPGAGFDLFRSQKMRPVVEPVQRMMETMPTMFQPNSSKLSRLQT